MGEAGLLPGFAQSGVFRGLTRLDAAGRGLVRLPDDRTAETVRDALTATMQTLPDHLKQSLTWDQGSEMGLHHEFSIATGIPVYFCDPHSPWQRGSNENTNGLLRQYFPKRPTSPPTPEHLAAVAAELNSRASR